MVWLERAALLLFVLLAAIGIAAIYGLYSGGAAYAPL
jgi:hypothetical protein